MQWHIPVMLREVLEALEPKPGGKFVDATLGDGGHAKEILQAIGPDGRLLGIERDPAMAQRAEERLQSFDQRLRIVVGSFRDLFEIARREKFLESDGIVFDLGVASWHFAATGKGFSFRFDEPLDMRFDPSTSPVTAADLINTASSKEIVSVLRIFGEEREASAITRAIIMHRPVYTTAELADIVVHAKRHHMRHIHPATRVFQALRIAVNRELDILETALPQAVSVLRVGGVVGVIAYHSLEDRIAKHFFSNNARNGALELLGEKAKLPTRNEVLMNPRARSAKFRAARRLR